MIRYTIVALAFISIFAFPYALTAALIVCAAFASPIAGIALGSMTDIFYFTSSASLIPVGTITGIIATIAAVFGQRLVRTHFVVSR